MVVPEDKNKGLYAVIFYGWLETCGRQPDYAQQMPEVAKQQPADSHGMSFVLALIKGPY
jgi:hypothetical protein